MNFNVPSAVTKSVPHDVLSLSSTYAHAVLEVDNPDGLVTWFVEGEEIPKSRAKNVNGVHVHARQEMILILPNNPSDIPDKILVTAKDNSMSLSMYVNVER
jgi:hypothetical protein